mgnify:CR=1 FL=1
MKGADECVNDVEKRVKSVWKYVERLRMQEELIKKQKNSIDKR